eukprot:Tamp_13963.p1 GENE.Tamp_13963~~Tamp_13963.p1  ORF type:complete len:237 (+),score=16.65 Tamp_13963:403-1113(+)
MIGICHNATVWQELFLPWWRCALRENCIAPPGASRDNHRYEQSALSILLHLLNGLYDSTGEEHVFVDKSHICWVSGSVLDREAAEKFESPFVRYPGINFYARRTHQPKPFKDLVIRRLAATGNEPFKDPDLSKCMLTFHLPPLRRDLLRPPASSNLGACILAFTPSRTHTCSHARSRVSATTADQCDDAKCTSSGNDCCAPLEIGEAATCKDSYIPVRAGQACGDYDEGLYRCCKS